MRLGYFAMPAHPPERDPRLGFDDLDQAGAWRHSLELLAREVAPKIAGGA